MKRLLLLTPFVIVIIFLVSYGVDSKLRGKALIKRTEDTKLRITFISPLKKNPYWDIVRDGMESANKKLGIDIKYTGQNQLSNSEQLDDIETAIASKVDGIITVASNTDVFTPIINKAINSGIPVVLIDTDAPKSKRDGYIGTANYKAGVEAGKAMIKATSGKAVIGIITASRDAANLNERIEGFRQSIKNQPGMEIAAVEEGKSDLLLITEKVQKMLKKNKKITAIFCCEGYGAIGTGKVIQSEGLTGKLTVIGFDDVAETIDYIKKGIIYGTIVQKPYQMGYLSVKLLYDIMRGKSHSNFNIDTGVTVVTSKNVYSYKNKR